MRKLKRKPGFELVLDVRDDGFIAPPHDAQRQWLLNRAINEFVWDLEALHAQAERFVPGRVDLALLARDAQDPAPDDIMELWQLPVMAAMADVVTAHGGDVLEIGYGRGESARMIAERGVASHTIVECVPRIAAECEQWASTLPDHRVSVLADRWEALTSHFGRYDGIFFHTYPLDAEEYGEVARRAAAVAEPFFEVAAAHLKPGGAFTYFSNEIDSLSRQHQRELLRHFAEFSVRPVRDLPLPEDVRDTWWIDEMIVVCARSADQ
ncbi:MAG: class I SAM-dependent methyltransferase [Pseudomonadota bacterium]